MCSGGACASARIARCCKVRIPKRRCARCWSSAIPITRAPTSLSPRATARMSSPSRRLFQPSSFSCAFRPNRPSSTRREKQTPKKARPRPGLAPRLRISCSIRRRGGGGGAPERPAGVTRVEVELGARSYDILIGPGLIARAGGYIQSLAPGASCAIVTDANVAAIHLPALEKSLDEAGVRHAAIIVAPGEASKSYAELRRGLRRAHRRAPRTAAIWSSRSAAASSAILRASPPRACGAACASSRSRQRLLAQVDSSVGGKTGDQFAARQESRSARFTSLRSCSPTPTCLQTLAAARIPRRLRRNRQIWPHRRCELLRLARSQLARGLFRQAPTASMRSRRAARAKAAIVARDEYRARRPRPAQSRPHLRPRARAARPLRWRAAGAWRGRRHRHGLRLPLLGATGALPAGGGGSRVEAHLRAVGLPTRIRDIAGWQRRRGRHCRGHAIRTRRSSAARSPSSSRADIGAVLHRQESIDGRATSALSCEGELKTGN